MAFGRNAKAEPDAPPVVRTAKSIVLRDSDGLHPQDAEHLYCGAFKLTIAGSVYERQGTESDGTPVYHRVTY